MEEVLAGGGCSGWGGPEGGRGPVKWGSGEVGVLGGGGLGVGRSWSVGRSWQVGGPGRWGSWQVGVLAGEVWQVRVPGGGGSGRWGVPRRQRILADEESWEVGGPGSQGIVGRWESWGVGGFQEVGRGGKDARPAWGSRCPRPETGGDASSPGKALESSVGKSAILRW